MPMTFAIRMDGIRSEGGANPRVDVSYTGSGSSDYNTAVTEFLAVISSTWGTLLLNAYRVDATEREDLWDCQATYTRSAQPEVGDSQFSFDTTGGSTTIKQALAHVASFKLPGITTAPDFEGAINVDGDGNVQGADIVLPAYAWSETRNIDPLYVTNAYKGLLFRLTGRMNLATFKALFKGECLFLGAVGSKRGADFWEIQYRFAGQPTLANGTIGGISGVSKYGWDYIWPEFETKTSGSPPRRIRRARALHVERVYEFGDFSLLGIGTL